MSKIVTFAQKIFGSSAGTNQISKFGSLFAGSPLFTTDASVAQSLSNWLDGWLSAAIGGNSPAIEDMNAVFFVITTQLAYLKQAGVAEWDAVTPYYIGSFANVAGALYVSIVDNNVNNAVTDTTKWVRYGANLQQFTTDATLTAASIMVEFDATLGVCVGTLPAAGASGVPGKKITITKTDSTANQVKVTDGTFVAYLLAQYDSITVFSNGSVWYAV